MGKYEDNRTWSDRYIPTIRQIVGPHLLVPSPFEVDCAQATDLIVLRARDMRIACRVRRPGYLAKYPNQFTIRSHLDNGAETELQKIINGFGDWMFYGHAIDNESVIIEVWWLIDLAAFRAHLVRDGFLRDKNKNRLRWGKKLNDDGTEFVWFDIGSFPATPSLLVASSDSYPM
jgi:hypothetical protein